MEGHHLLHTCTQQQRYNITLRKSYCASPRWRLRNFVVGDGRYCCKSNPLTTPPLAPLGPHLPPSACYFLTLTTLLTPRSPCIPVYRRCYCCVAGSSARHLHKRQRVECRRSNGVRRARHGDTRPRPGVGRAGAERQRYLLHRRVRQDVRHHEGGPARGHGATDGESAFMVQYHDLGEGHTFK